MPSVKKNMHNVTRVITYLMQSFYRSKTSSSFSAHRRRKIQSHNGKFRNSQFRRAGMTARDISIFPYYVYILEFREKRKILNFSHFDRAFFIIILNHFLTPLAYISLFQVVKKNFTVLLFALLRANVFFFSAP